MMLFYIIIVVAVLLWKGYYATLRAMNTYQQDRKDHDSLREYLLGNGATQWQSLQPFYLHAAQRALQPMAKQWQLWLALLLLGIVVVLLR